MARDPVFDDPLIAALIELALQEDLGEGDRTSQALVPSGARARGRLAAKEPLVVCGLPLLELVFEQLGDVVITLRVASTSPGAARCWRRSKAPHARSSRASASP